MLKQRNKTSLRPVIQNNVGRYLVLFVFVFASCRTLDYPPKAYVRYELGNATLLLEKNDLLEVINTRYDYPDEQSKNLLKDYTCLCMPIVFKHDSIPFYDKTWPLYGDVYSSLYELFKKHKPLVFDKRRNVFDKKYYFKEYYGEFYVFFEDGQVFFHNTFSIIE